MNEAELKARTKAFGLGVLGLLDTLPESRSARILANQLGRCATAVGANYRAACRSRSHAEMVSKLAIVEEEADESAYWLELVAERSLTAPDNLRPLLTEANELTAIMVASRRTLQKRLGR